MTLKALASILRTTGETTPILEHMPVKKTVLLVLYSAFGIPTPCIYFLEDKVQWTDEIVRNYPSCTVSCLMNMLGTHDTSRIQTSLGGKELFDAPREIKASEQTDEVGLLRAIGLLKLAVLI